MGFLQAMSTSATSEQRRNLIAVLLIAAAMAILGTHATRGIVQTIDATTLVIARTGNRGVMAFSLTPSTRREGVIVVGASVSVRYREDGKNHVATAIALQRTKE